MNRNVRIAKQLLRIARSIIAIQRKESNKELFQKIYVAFEKLQDDVEKHGTDNSVKLFFTNLLGMKNFDVKDKSAFIKQLQQAIIGNHLENADKIIESCNENIEKFQNRMKQKYENMNEWYVKEDQEKGLFYDYSNRGEKKPDKIKSNFDVYKKKFEKFSEGYFESYDTPKKISSNVVSALKEINMLLNGSLKQIPDDAKKALSKGIKQFKDAVVQTVDDIKSNYQNKLKEMKINENDSDTLYEKMKSLFGRVKKQIEEQEKYFNEKSEEDQQKDKEIDDAERAHALYLKKNQDNVIKTFNDYAKSYYDDAMEYNDWYDEQISKDKDIDEASKKRLKQYAKQVIDLETEVYNNLFNEVIENIKSAKFMGKEYEDKWEKAFEEIVTHKNSKMKEIDEQFASERIEGKYLIDANGGRSIHVVPEAINILKAISKWFEEDEYRAERNVKKIKEQKREKEMREQDKKKKSSIQIAKKLVVIARRLLNQ